MVYRHKKHFFKKGIEWAILRFFKDEKEAGHCGHLISADWQQPAQGDHMVSWSMRKTPHGKSAVFSV